MDIFIIFVLIYLSSPTFIFNWTNIIAWCFMSFILIPLIVAIVVFVWCRCPLKTMILLFMKIMGVLFLFVSTFFLWKSIAYNNNETFWQIFTLVILGIILIAVDISKIFKFRAAGIEFELEQTKKELKDTTAELFNTQGNLNKLQWNWAKSMYDYAVAAKYYAEKNEWNKCCRMLMLINKYTEIGNEKLKAFTGQEFQYKDICKPLTDEEKDDLLEKMPKSLQNKVSESQDVGIKLSHAVMECYEHDLKLQESKKLPEQWLIKAIDAITSIKWIVFTEENIPVAIGEINEKIQWTIHNLDELMKTAIKL